MKGSEKLIATIKEQDIRQVPKWRFLVKNGLAWVVFLIAVLLGAGAFSVILFAIQQTDFNVVNHLAHSRLELFLGLLPFVWLSFLIVFLLVAFHSVQYSKKGYKFTVAKRFGFSAGLSILLGTLFFIGGGAHQLEHAFAVNVELYESIQQKKMKLWSMPEDGYLSGKIEAVNDDYLQLKDFNGTTWQVSYDSAFIAPVVQLEPGETIKMIGKMTSENGFKAQEIRPWGGRGRRMGGN
jgi:hypothetical protein